ncbi:hypothetical protein NL676_028609 [Syzygium grande]|nr:hypothetical protein NL676_028609 [Syzygium grande]
MDGSALNSAELQRLISQEKERAMVNEMVAKLTSACWDKCITGTPGINAVKLRMWKRKLQYNPQYHSDSVILAIVD